MVLVFVTFLFALSVLLLIHEMGHVVVAKWMGKKIGSTASKISIIIAGVVMNLLLAVGITTYLLVDGVMEPSGRVHVEKVHPGSPAESAGFLPKDVISSYRTQKDFIIETRKQAGQKIILPVLRDGKALTIAIVPRKNPPPGEGAMGMNVSDLEKKTYSLIEAPVKALQINFLRAKKTLVSLGSTLWRLVTFQRLETAGLIGVGDTYSLRAILELMSILSLNLAVLALLPLPGFDGGRLVLVFFEKFLGRRIKFVFEHAPHWLGLAVIFILMLLVSFH